MIYSVVKSTKLYYPMLPILCYIEAVKSNISVAHTSCMENINSTQDLDHAHKKQLS